MATTVRLGLRLAVIALPVLLYPAAAFAEDVMPSDGSTVASPSRAPEAPVGHRQPRAADVPADTRQDKDALADRIDRINQKFDRELKICRNC
jgi:hypothetical protein